MTTSTARLPVESWPIGAPSSPSASSPAPVLYREFSAPRPLPLPNTVSLESLIEEFEADHEMVDRMAEARRQMAATVYAGESETLNALRLAAGLSQAQLASKVATSQSHIARIEHGQNDPSTDLIARIAQALGIDEIKVFQAIRNQRANRGN